MSSEASLGLCHRKWRLLLEAVNKLLLIPREGSHFLLSYFQVVWKEKSIAWWDMINACCRAPRLLMSLSSLSSDNFSERADRETLFKDVQSSRKVSVPICVISHSFLISHLAFPETESGQECTKAGPLSVHQSFLLLDWPCCLSVDHWHFCTRSSATEKKEVKNEDAVIL